MLRSQVTSIFGSSMEVLICVDGESPGGSVAAAAANGTSGGDGSSHGGAPEIFHCGSAFATVRHEICFDRRSAQTTKVLPTRTRKNVTSHLLSLPSGLQSQCIASDPGGVCSIVSVTRSV